MARLLRKACANGWLTRAQRLWARGPLTLADVRSADNYAFRLACAKGHLTTAQWLWGLRDAFSARSASSARGGAGGESDHLTLADVRSADNYAFLTTCINGHLTTAQWLGCATSPHPPGIRLPTP